MLKTIKRSGINGELTAPASKSMMQRAVAAALLAEGQTILHNPSLSDDGLASLNIAKDLGATIKNKNNTYIINGGFSPKTNQINCNESGLSMRMFTPIAALHSSPIEINGKGSLTKRPVNMIVDALKQMGVEIRSNKNFLPMQVQGPLKGGHALVDGSISSQLLTGLLMALPVVEQDSILDVKELKSKPYIDMTLQLLNDFGIDVKNDNYQTFTIQGKQKYTPRDYKVEGDWSGASFLLVAAAITGQIRINELQNNSKQSDKEIIKVLEMVGATVVCEKDFTTVKKNTLNAFEFDATECPDLFPPLVALAAACKGNSIIKGADRLKHKESDRATVLKMEYEKIGIEINIHEKEMIVKGGQIKSGTINSHNDHRIAMAGAVSGLVSNNSVTIEQAECIAKSYPGFYDDLQSICLNK